MTPLDMIAEWRKGCTVAGPMHSKCYPDGEPLKTGYCVECTEALIDALDKALQRTGWQGIESAPLDGTLVDLWSDGERSANCRWDEDDEWWEQAYSEATDCFAPLYDVEPTHWMLPPAAPQVDPS